MAPAGTSASLRAALSAGADAVYLGLTTWSARAFAGNFDETEVLRAIDTAHLYGAAVHLTLNTLLKDGEVGPALAALEAPYEAGLDAVLVADLGLGAEIRSRLPDLALHASTQLNTHSSAQLALLARLGFRRAVLARELSLHEIAALRPHGLQLEAFVHGALCYGYSGSCLFSSMVGGRSGNRGRCAQACRMRYALSAEGERAAACRPSADAASSQGSGGAPSAQRSGGAPSSQRSCGEPSSQRSSGGRRRSARTSCRPADRASGEGATRVLSTADLSALDALPALLQAGICSFKIEGRMKDASYVATAVSVYREALDAAIADPEGYSVRPEWIARLEQSFSRTFTSAHLHGRHSEIRSGGRGGHRGVLVGRVEEVDEAQGTARFKLAQPVSAGDVVAVYTSGGQSEPVRLSEDAQRQLTLRLPERVAVKDRLFRLTAAEQDRAAREAVAGRTVARPVLLTAHLHGHAGTPAVLTLDCCGVCARAVSAADLAPARRAALTEERAAAAIGALGGTPYRLDAIAFDVEPGLFLPVADLKEMRRQAVADLDRLRLSAYRRSASRQVGTVMAEQTPPTGSRSGQAGSRSNLPAEVAASTRGPAQDVPSDVWADSVRLPSLAAGVRRVRAASRQLPVVVRIRPGDALPAAPGVFAICLDLETGDAADGIEDAVHRVIASGLQPRCRPPQILFDEDMAWWERVGKLPWAAVYARHPAHLAVAADAIAEYPLIGLNSRTPACLSTVLSQMHPSGEPSYEPADLSSKRGRRALAGVVVSPELSLPEIAGFVHNLADSDYALSVPGSHDGSQPAIEALVAGREQLLLSRDRLGEAEGIVRPARSSRETHLVLEDAKGYRFPVQVVPSGARILNSMRTDLTGRLAELTAAGVGAAIVQLSQLPGEQRDEFLRDGLRGAARHAGAPGTTTGHLFRGVD